MTNKLTQPLLVTLSLFPVTLSLSLVTLSTAKGPDRPGPGQSERPGIFLKAPP